MPLPDPLRQTREIIIQRPSPARGLRDAYSKRQFSVFNDHSGDQCPANRLNTPDKRRHHRRRWKADRCESPNPKGGREEEFLDTPERNTPPTKRRTKMTERGASALKSKLRIVITKPPCGARESLARSFYFAATCMGVPSLISSVARRTTVSPGLRFPNTSIKSPSVTPLLTSTHSARPS